MAGWKYGTALMGGGNKNLTDPAISQALPVSKMDRVAVEFMAV